jgi:hypothetical protein
VMLGLSGKVTVTLIVSLATDTIPCVGVCSERGWDEDSGRWEVVRKLEVTPLLAGVSVGWAGRLDAVSPSGCCRAGWVGPGDSTGPSVAAISGFRTEISGAVEERAGLWLGALGVSCGSCSCLSLGVGRT